MSTRRSLTSTLGASGNLSRADQAVISRDPGGPLVKAGTISFTAGTVADSANGLALFLPGDLLEIRGSARNSRTVTVTAGTAASLTVTPAILTVEAAGPLITLRRMS